jgi:hypothetical protein
MRGARRRIVGHQLVRAVVVIAAVACPSLALAESVSVGGVSFWAPSDLVSQGKQPEPIAFSWKNTSDTLSVTVASLPASEGGNAESAKEYQDWPGVGRSFVKGFGNGNAKGLGMRYGAECTFTGAPISRDLERMAIQIQVDTTCATTPEPFQLRTRLINILTRTATITVRVDSVPDGDSEAEAITAGIWKTVKVEPGQRVAPVASGADEMDSQATGTPVSGGPGVRLKDYGLMRPAAIAGEYFGALIGGLAVGALLSMLLMRFGAKPLPALIGAQVLLTLLRVWGDEQDGVWELDPLRDGVAALIVIFALRRWAQRRWEKRNPTPSPQPDRSPHP